MTDPEECCEGGCSHGLDSRFRIEFFILALLLDDGYL
jgi:hypothetical protein